MLWSAVCHAQPCPPEATASVLQFSVAAFRSDGVTPVGSEAVQAGDILVMRSAVIFVPVNPIDGTPSASFSGGAMTIGGSDVTTPGGVPLLGYPDCGGALFARSAPFRRTVTQADAAVGVIFMQGTYSNSTLKASSTVLVRVQPSRDAIVPRPKTPVAPSKKRAAKLQAAKRQALAAKRQASAARQ